MNTTDHLSDGPAAGNSNWETWHVTLRGMRCICRPGCTTGDVWGDGPRDCKGPPPSYEPCEPCSLMAGKPYTPPC